MCVAGGLSSGLRYLRGDRGIVRFACGFRVGVGWYNIVLGSLGGIVSGWVGF